MFSKRSIMNKLFKLNEYGHKFNWILSILIATVVSLIILDVADITARIEILFAIFLGASFIFLVSFAIGIYKDYDKQMLADRVPLDAILQKQFKTVIFDDATFSGNGSEVHAYRKLYNNMKDSNETYDFFKWELISNDDVPNLNDITVSIDGNQSKLLDLDSESTKPERSLVYKCDDSDSCNLDLSEPIEKRIVFFIPLNLKPNCSCAFDVSYRTKAYEPAYNGESDYIQERITRITDELLIHVKLEGTMKIEYNIVPAIDSKDSTIMKFKIFDASSERMTRTEMVLENQPEYNDISASWAIKNPKIGYQYRMYFKLIKKVRSE